MKLKWLLCFTCCLGCATPKSEPEYNVEDYNLMLASYRSDSVYQRIDLGGNSSIGILRDSVNGIIQLVKNEIEFLENNDNIVSDKTGFLGNVLINGW